MVFGRRRVWAPFVALIIVSVYYFWRSDPASWNYNTLPLPAFIKDQILDPEVLHDDHYFWATLPMRYPPVVRNLPTGKPKAFPPVQKAFDKEKSSDRTVRLSRQNAVRGTFLRCWNSYKKQAWLADELAPVSGAAFQTFGGWGATLVDSLDTLWIMGLSDEFELAASAAANISFETTAMEEINVFETTIRYLGGFLSAYDLSGDQRLLRKAREIGDMLYVAFDTPNRMPITRWKVTKAAKGEDQTAAEWALLAEVGSLCLEFTRLSQITGDPKWFDATERIREVLEMQQVSTQIPGLWPITINARDKKFNFDTTFALGAMADSTFEYLPKMAALTGGLVPNYETMYLRAMEAAISSNIFRPMVPDNADILVSGVVTTTRDKDQITKHLDPQAQHLVCFVGGMLALGGKLFNRNDHQQVGEKVTDGCVWTYKAMPLGIMPETFYMVPCQDPKNCLWNETQWKVSVLERAGERGSDDMKKADALISEKHLLKGFSGIGDSRYILRPEAIESVFVLYRTTGRKDLLDAAWAMWRSIESSTRTELAHAALADVTVSTGRSSKVDSMESFWMGETLKYFYLIFSEPDLINLDEFVFNTEAHPFRRLLP